MVKNTLMPQDGRSEAIPVLGFKKDGNQTVTSNAGGTARNTTAFTTTVVTVVTDQTVILAQGTADTVTATANDCKLYPNIPYDISLVKDGIHYPYMAFRTVSAEATVDIAERD